MPVCLNLTQNTGFQISGFLNNADTLRGGQIAGFLNNSRKKSSLQIAGAINRTKEQASVQVSGLMNTAGHLKGIQLGLLNFADSSSGVSLGLFSFIKKGYHKLEISADEIFPANIAFRTGTKQFHTFFTAGASGFTAGASTFNANKMLWNVGYGIGTSIGNQNKLLFDIDFSSQEVMYRNNINGAYHWYRFYMGFDRKIMKK
ncbi:MAG: hypothetical protein HC905_08420 [Bacteroidales bacterium]|nr:hypothetical protein [Bacteroidales bacterium]